jgi:hypothetical protein
MSMNVDGHPSRIRPKDGLCEGWPENKKSEHGDDKWLKRMEEENMLCRPQLEAGDDSPAY